MDKQELYNLADKIENSGYLAGTYTAMTIFITEEGEIGWTMTPEASLVELYMALSYVQKNIMELND